MREIQSESQLLVLLASGASLRGVRFQGLNLREHRDHLLERHDFRGVVVLGGRLGKRLEQHLRRHGALVFPSDPAAPIDPYRARLYHPSELYTGVAHGDYDGTPDAAAYRWATDARLLHDTYVTTLRAIHDDSMSDALDETLAGWPVVGVMGGHDLDRASSGYEDAAQLGHRLAGEGFVVLTGGGPGAMEAANLGAYAADEDSLRAALTLIGQVPRYGEDITAWARVALRARRDLDRARRDLDRARPSAAPGETDRPRSIGVPTWFYGHEPPNVFCDGIAKYFSNALREEGLLARSTAGVVVLPGAAGTVQEICQAVTPLYYSRVTTAPEGSPGAGLPKLVLVGVEHWTQRVPVWPLVQALAQGRAMADVIHLVDAVDGAAALIAGG